MTPLTSFTRATLLLSLAIGLGAAGSSVVACGSDDGTTTCTGAQPMCASGCSASTGASCVDGEWQACPDAIVACPSDAGQTDGGGACSGDAPSCFGNDTSSCCGQDPAGTAVCTDGQWLCGGAAAPGCDGTSCLALDGGGDQFAPGVYGGTGVQVTIASDESATIEFDCAVGTMDPITVTATGSTGAVFQTRGTVKDTPGVQQVDGGPEAQPATYLGHKFGSAISFTYTLDGSDASTGSTYTATLGQSAMILRCE
jgi:hypothetical protein